MLVFFTRIIMIVMYLDHELRRRLGLFLQHGLQLAEVDLHLVDHHVGLAQLAQPVKQAVARHAKLLALFPEQPHVQVDEVEIALGRGIEAPPQLRPEALR
eukprot:5159314-Pyramimonas_sp.AAC.2